MHRISQSSLFFTAPISPPGFPEGAGASHDRLPEHVTSKCPERTNGGKVKYPEVPAGWGTQERGTAPGISPAAGEGAEGQGAGEGDPRRQPCSAADAWHLRWIHDRWWGIEVGGGGGGIAGPAWV